MGILNVFQRETCPYLNRKYISDKQITFDIIAKKTQHTNDNIQLTPKRGEMVYRDEFGDEILMSWRFEKRSGDGYYYNDDYGNQWKLSDKLFTWTIPSKGHHVSFFLQE
jgi:hypothetical protein